MRNTEGFEKLLVGVLFASEVVDVTEGMATVLREDFSTVYLGSTNWSPLEVVEFGEKYGVLEHDKDDFYSVNHENRDEMVDVLLEIQKRLSQWTLDRISAFDLL